MSKSVTDQLASISSPVGLLVRLDASHRIDTTKLDASILHVAFLGHVEQVCCDIEGTRPGIADRVRQLPSSWRHSVPANSLP